MATFANPLVHRFNPTLLLSLLLSCASSALAVPAPTSCPNFGCSAVGQCSSSVSGQLDAGGPGLFSKMSVVPGIGSVTQYSDCCAACTMFPAACSYFTFAVLADGTKQCFLYGPAICSGGGSGATFSPQEVSDMNTSAVAYTTGAICKAVSSPPPPAPIGVKGDPHYTGADASHFDFTGLPDKSYCILSDAHLHINVYHGGRFDRWGANPAKPLTWIRQVAVFWGHHTLRLAARAGATWQYGSGGYMARMAFDGEDFAVPGPGKSAEFAGGGVVVTWVAGGVRDGDDDVDEYEVVIGRGDVLRMRLTLRPEVSALRTPADGVVHFSIDLPRVMVSGNVHGVLGQTFRGDHNDRLRKQNLVYSSVVGTQIISGDNAEGFLDGTPSDYEASGLMSPDCKQSRFARGARLDEETARSIEMSTAGVYSQRGGRTSTL